MTRFVLSLTAAIGIVALPALASADPDTTTYAYADRDVAIGIAVGSTSGLSINWGYGDSALALTAGVDYDDHTDVHLDYLRNIAYLRPNFPLYLGVGGFVKDHPMDTSVHAGVRMPLGVRFDFRQPVQLFAEVAPSLVVFDRDGHRREGIAGALGVRARF